MSKSIFLAPNGFALKPERSEGFKGSHKGPEKYKFFEYMKKKSCFLTVWREKALFLYDKLFLSTIWKTMYVHRGGGQVPLPFTLPRPLCLATPPPLDNDSSIYRSRRVDFSSIGLLGSKEDEAFVGVALALWAWPCWHGHSEQSELLPSLQRSRPQGQGHAHKGLVLFGTQKTDFRSIDEKFTRLDR